MSTFEKNIEKLLESKALYEWIPIYVDHDFTHVRKLYMSEEAYSVCPPQGASMKGTMRGKGRTNTEVLLESYTGGMTMEQNFHMKMLDPTKDMKPRKAAEQVWTFRVFELPKIRLFGWFAGHNSFVVTHIIERDKLEKKSGGPKWQEQIDKCINKRKNQYSDLPIFNAGTNLSNYIPKAVNS